MPPPNSVAILIVGQPASGGDPNGNRSWWHSRSLADVYAIVKIVQSTASTGAKVLWVVLILLLPVLGLILWWLLGPKG